MIIPKTREEIEIMRESALLVSKTLGEIAKVIRPGVTTLQLDKLAEEFIRDHGAEPGFLGMYGFPNSLCVSPNAQVVHGIPNNKPLEEGDVISVDCGVLKNGYYGDHAYSFEIGEVAPEAKKLLQVTKESLYVGIREFRAGNRVEDVGNAIQKYCEGHGYGVVRELVGHGLGKKMHEENKIGEYIASLIEDRSTLQMGIGSIPNAALRQLTNHKDLGLHTEMFSDGVIDLIEKDVINCNYKGTLRGRVLATFLIGSKRLYEFVNDNPFIEMKESSMVNDTARIRKNPNMVAINSAIEVDLTGQVCADSIGPRMYSGVGGQMDFIRGASLSPGGKAIIALPSITKRGESRIVPFLKQGAGVVTTRGHIHYVITEYGIADLYGKTLKQRANELVNIAHPSHRERIDKEYYELLHQM